MECIRQDLIPKQGGNKWIGGGHINHDIVRPKEIKLPAAISTGNFFFVNLMWFY